MSERVYAVWVVAPHLGSQPRIIPAASSRYWAERVAERHRAAGATAKVVYRYSFMPDMPWEDA
ncbi:MAG: hypothetical protein ACJ786_20205 [Catenulispora sp.]